MGKEQVSCTHTGQRLIDFGGSDFLICPTVYDDAVLAISIYLNNGVAAVIFGRQKQRHIHAGTGKYLLQSGAVRAVWSEGRKVYSAE